MKKIVVFCLIFAFFHLSFFAERELNSEQVSGINFYKSGSVSSPMNFEPFPINISMNSAGDVAVSYRAATFKGVLLFLAEDSEILDYHFHADGGFAVELLDKEIIIFLERGDHELHYDMNGNFLFRENLPGGGVTEICIQLEKTTRIENSTSILLLEKNFMKWELYLNDFLIMRCDPIYIFFQNSFPVALFFIGIVANSVVFYMYFKKRKIVTEARKE